MNNMKKYGQGFSIVELMVAMVLGFLILAGMLSAYLSNSASFRFNSQMARVQENGRLAISLLENDIRMAAYGGCAKTALDEDGYEPGIEVLPSAPATLDVDKLLQGVDWDSATNQLTIYSIPARIDSATSTPEEGQDAFINSDCDSGDTKIEATEDTTVDIHAPIISRVTYRLDGTNLMVQRGDAPEVTLIENVDAFGVCFGVDAHGAGTDVKMEENVEWVSDFPAEKEKKQRITALQVDLILASAEKDDVLTEAVAPSIARCASTPSWTAATADKRLHKLFHSTVTLRNKVPNGFGNCDGGSSESSRCKEIAGP
jgi:type II secretory pathway component PulJ